MKKHLLLSVLLIVSSGCSTAAFFYQSDAPQGRNSVDPESVKIYAENIPDFKYIVLGSIAVDSAGNADSAAKLLKEKASKIGANAVIGTRATSLSSFASSRSGLSGVAVIRE